MLSTSPGIAPPVGWVADAGARGIALALRPWQALMTIPTVLFLCALGAMLLRHPDVPFYEIDRVAFVLLLLGVIGQTVVAGQRLLVLERATWPMLGLMLLAVSECDWSAVRLPDMVIAGGKVHRAVRTFSFSRARVSRGAEAGTLRTVRARSVSLPLLHVDCFHGRREITHFPSASYWMKALDTMLTGRVDRSSKL